MGVSVSAAVAIVFIGIIVSATVFFSVFDSITTNLIDTNQKNSDSMVDRLQTDIKITNATYNYPILTLTMVVRNTGSTILDPSKCQIIIDGKLMTKSINWTFSNVSGFASKIWSPGTDLNIDIPRLLYSFGTHPTRIKIVTQNGISDYTTDIYIPP